MSDRQHPPRSAGSPGSATTHPSHPEPVGENEEKKPKLPVSVVQVGASAGAAVTSAVAASYFGVGGTLAGAAFGSVVSTVAGALYTESLSKAHKVVQTTTAVVVQRFPGDVAQADSIRRMNGPAGVPVADSLNRVGSEDTRHTDVEHVQVPIADETQVMHPYDDTTRVMPPAHQQANGGQHGYGGQQSYGSQQSYGGSQTYGGQQTYGGHGGYDRQTGQHPTYGEQPRSRSAQRRAEAEQSWWKKPGFVMAGLSMAGFLIALAFILGTETAIGRPISGGDSGNTLTRLTSSDTDSKTEDEEGGTPTPTGSPSETGTPTDEVTPTSTDSEAPSQSVAPETSTSEPTDTDPDAGSEGVEPTEGPQSTEGDLGGDSAPEGDTGADGGEVQEQPAP